MYNTFMRYKWLNKQNNQKLILFFNGWGMDEAVVSHLDYTDYDVLMFYDYRTQNTDFDFNSLNNYLQKNLIAWSMGVMMASLGKFDSNYFSQTVAINGTLKPIDVKYGIAPRIYDLTIRGFNETGRKRFLSSMFNNPQDINCSRSIEEQLSELIAIKNYSSNENFKYNKIYISDDDKIIPTKSQIEFWGTEPNIKAGHCPFLQFSKWNEIL